MIHLHRYSCKQWSLALRWLVHHFVHHSDCLVSRWRSSWISDIVRILFQAVCGHKTMTKGIFEPVSQCNRRLLFLSNDFADLLFGTAQNCAAFKCQTLNYIWSVVCTDSRGAVFAIGIKCQVCAWILLVKSAYSLNLWFTWTEKLMRQNHIPGLRHSLKFFLMYVYL